MRVLAITDTEALSGAGIAALRIQRAVAAAGATARMVVARRQSDDMDVTEMTGSTSRRLHTARRAMMKVALRALGAEPGETLSANLLPSGMQCRINSLDTDVLHLHWIGLEMLRIEEVARLSRPVVWTMHDEWFALGLEHYAPIEDIRLEHRGVLFRALDASVRRRKTKAWRDCDPEIVCPSRWLAGRIAAADVVPPDQVHVIRNTVPLDAFHPQDRSAAKVRLGLTPERLVVGMGALNAEGDRRKGFDYLRGALEVIASRSRDRPPVVLILGGKIASGLPLEARSVGTICGDDELATHYAAMDVFVCPSRIENLPNTVAEALACGVPCVAFDVGGISDLIRHGENGYLARPYAVDELAIGLENCLDTERRASLSAAARDLAERTLSGPRVAEQYLAVYRRAIDRRRGVDLAN